MGDLHVLHLYKTESPLPKNHSCQIGFHLVEQRPTSTDDRKHKTSSNDKNSFVFLLCMLKGNRNQEFQTN